MALAAERAGRPVVMLERGRPAAGAMIPIAMQIRGMSVIALPDDQRVVLSGKDWQMIVLAEIAGQRMIEPPW